MGKHPNSCWSTYLYNICILITNCIFEALLKCKYSTEIYSPSTISEPSKEISVDEANALYYVRGYLIRNLIKKFKKDANKVIALSHFLEDTEAGDAEVFSQQEWTDLFDRGGLFHCNIDFYHFLYSVEVIMKTAIKDEEGSLKDGFVGRAKNSVTTNDEVQFWWDCLCIINNLDDDLATTLFDNIISLYITVGGFCFASKWMERYKQTTTLSIINTLFSF